MIHEYGYDFPETDAEKSCVECSEPLDTWCDMCGDPVCDAHLALRGEKTLCGNCEELAEQVELDELWGRMFERGNDHPAGIVHMAWAHSQNGRDISTPAHEHSVLIFKFALSDIWSGWTEAA